ncbi:MAG TPA: EAL domain-containing protein [Steroidobacteraceae bacterium]
MSDTQTASAAAERRDAAGLLGRRLLQLLAPLRVRRLTLHDAQGELLWLSQGEFGAAEQRYIQDTQDAFGLDGSTQHMERDLEHGRRALFFCARTPLGKRSDLACAIISSRRRADVDMEGIKSRVFAAMGRFSSTAPGAPGAPAADTALPAFRVRSSQRTANKPESAPVRADDAPLRSRAYSRLLRSGGTTRRYEIARDDSESLSQDLDRANRLIQLLQKRGTRDAPAPASFTLPVCVASVLTPDFLAQLAPTIEKAGLADDMLGLCIPAAAWEQDFAATQRFIEQCGQHRCFVALDDFNLTRPGFALLRSSALRCLKLDAALTANALDDKFAHANVAAIVKAARVLGLYCVAKGVKTPAAARWMASAGIEFADRPSRGGIAVATTRNGRALALAKGS